MEFRHVGGRHVRDVGLAAIQRFDLARVQIDPGGGKSSAGELHRKRESDVPQSDDTHTRCAGRELVFQGRCGGNGGRTRVRHVRHYYVSPVSLPLAAWLVVNALHVWLTVRATRPIADRAQPSADDRFFHATVGIVSGLAASVHVAAITAGLSVLSGAVCLAVWHAGLAWTVRGAPASSDARRWSVAESAAAAMLLAVSLSWIDAATRSPAVYGADAAHYHVPNAMNIANGASLFDLPATPHLYPLAGSAVAAWFIVPLGDPLMVDLAMLLPFLMTMAAIAVIVRALTGASGLAWGTWIGLALFSTAMLKSASMGAADLWLASSFVATVATIVSAWSRGRWRTADLLALGCCVGLLVGSKTTGSVAAALLLVGYGAMALARRWSRGKWMPRLPHVSRGVTAALTLSVLTGGIWLIRNWVQFGSPVAPSGLEIFGVQLFDGESTQRSKYLSVLAEMDTDSFHLWPRATYFLGQWFGDWYLTLLWPAVLLGLDVAVTPHLRRDDRWWARAGFMALTAGAGSVLIWMLIGAPWTGLERSRGQSLRYALPVLILLPVGALAGLFSFARQWTPQPRLRGLLLALVAAASVALFWRAQSDPASGVGLPPLELRWLLVAMVASAIHAAAGTRKEGRAPHTLAAVVAVSVMAVTASALTARDASAHDDARRRAGDEEATYRSGVPPANVWRRVYWAAIGAESSRQPPCSARRFYALVRFDEPLALQAPWYGTEVYYAARDVEAARRAGPLGRCDYAITTAAVADTQKGQRLLDALFGGQPVETAAATPQFLLIALRQP